MKSIKGNSHRVGCLFFYHKIKHIMKHKFSIPDQLKKNVRTFVTRYEKSKDVPGSVADDKSFQLQLKHFIHEQSAMYAKKYHMDIESQLLEIFVVKRNQRKREKGDEK